MRQRDFEDLPLSVIRTFDVLADEFEAAWRSGAAPDFRTYVIRLDNAGNGVETLLAAHLSDIEHELCTLRVAETARNRFKHPISNRSDETDAPRGLTDTVGAYAILEQLGAGGMGVVFKAKHVQLGRIVAIKFPRIAAQVDDRIVTRFLREARLIGSLNHAHIVKALDAGSSDYGPYLVTEYIEGETLEAMVRRVGPLPYDIAVRYALQAADALAHAHLNGVIHRDVKPSNLLLDKEGLLRIVDFGLARSVENELPAANSIDASEQTEWGIFLGTVSYAAPEQLCTGQLVDQRTDVYGLGCVLYFMLTGLAPHQGTLADRISAYWNNASTSVKIESKEVPARLRRGVRRMTAVSLQDRLGSMSAVQQMLGDACQGSQETSRTFYFSVACGLATIVCVLMAALWARDSQSGASPESGLAGPVESSHSRAVAPFGPEQARLFQKQWAEKLDLPIRLVNSAEMTLALIPPGEFMMGNDDATSFNSSPDVGNWRYREPNTLRHEHRPMHRVTLSKPFYVSETEVTNAQFARFVDSTGYITDAERDKGWGKEDVGWVERGGYSWRNIGQRPCEDDCPVINVSWNDAIAFCKWLSNTDQLGAYRPPTEAEWEFACRAGSESELYSGNDARSLAKHAWFAWNSEGRFHPVALKQPNSFGLYDMHGNRQEWCLDGYAIDYYASSPSEDPLRESDERVRVLRGGAYRDNPDFCTAWRRWHQDQNDTSAAGIRVVCEPRVPM